jgi:hypothetical protein
MGSQIGYTPVVGEFLKSTSDFGTHGGKVTISSEGVEYEKVGISLSKITQYATQTCDGFFYITNGEETPASVGDDLRFTAYVDVSDMSSITLLMGPVRKN